MAPKTTANAAKLALCHQWILKSGVAHTLKDFEKALPSIASINGMAVKDYVQALTDENMIRVEKIGSGNWYWSFPSEVRLQKEDALARVQAEHDKAAAAVDELTKKIDEESAAREEADVEDIEEEAGLSRGEMLERHSLLVKTVDALRAEASKYNDNDPAEFARRVQEVEKTKAASVNYTDQILSMESWMKARFDKGGLQQMKREWYGVEFDEEEEGLKELQG